MFHRNLISLVTHSAVWRAAVQPRCPDPHPVALVCFPGHGQPSVGTVEIQTMQPASSPTFLTDINQYILHYTLD